MNEQIIIKTGNVNIQYDRTEFNRLRQAHDHAFGSAENVYKEKLSSFQAGSEWQKGESFEEIRGLNEQIKILSKKVTEMETGLVNRY